MRFNALSKVLLTGLGCGLVAAACSAPDPGAYELSDKTPRVGSSSGQTSSGQTSSGQTSSGTSGGSSSGTSGGSSSGTSGSTSSSGDAGKDSAAPVPAAFVGAPAYVATNGQDPTNAAHGGNNNLPPSHNCFSCHSAAGPGKEMTIAGYVKGGAKIEVRAIDGNGTVVQAYTEANGYFYVLGTALSGNYNVGVRNGTTAVGMVTPLTAGGCGSGACHGGSQGDVHLP